MGKNENNYPKKNYEGVAGINFTKRGRNERKKKERIKIINI